jgi:hypothetical protein
MMKTLLASLSTAALLILSSAGANAQTEIFTDTFDAAPTNGATRALSIDNSATGGQFPSSFFDVFGIVDRTVNFDFADDSVINNADADPDNDDTFGLVKPDKTDMFLGFADTANNDNPDGDVSVTWTISTAGQTDLNLSFEIAAMGDFESTDTLTFTASFDDGATETLVTSTFIDTPDGETFTYTLDDGSLAIPFNADSDIPTNIKDPFVIDGQLVINEFQTFSFPITGSGSELTLTLNYNTNGGPEPVAIDNVSVTSGGGGGDVLKGDVDLSGTVTFLDISPFIMLLSSDQFQEEADCDCDGDLDFLDIQPFIDILSGN